MTDTLPERRQTSAPPEPPPWLPDIPGPWETVVLFWRWLRRMSTALLLLFALAVGSVIGTFVPQEPVIATTVESWREGTAGPGAGVSRVFDALGFYDVFGSWWFLGITVLLFVSLTGCLVPRVRAFRRTASRRPPAGRNLDKLSNSVTIRTDLDPAQALAVVEQVLRRRRFRVRRIPVADTPMHRAAGTDAADPGRPAQVAAERGHWREGGSLIFHCAFYLLLIGVFISQGFGFTGQVNMVEGDAPIVDTRLTYGLASPGRWFGLEDHRGFAVRLDDFTVEYHDNDTPSEFRSDIAILEGDEVVKQGAVRVNEPFRHDGMNIYQIRFGMAPHIIVRAGDLELFNDRVPMSQASGGVWTGVAKVSTSEGRQMALDLAFVPDVQIVEDDRGGMRVVSGSPQPENPTVFADLYVGELGLERPVPAEEFDRSEGPAVSEIVLPPGQPQSLVNGELSIEFADVGQWTGFQISHQPGRVVLVLAAALVLLGLIPSLYSYRRRIWAEARTVAQAGDEDPGAGHGQGGATQVRLAGVALQRGSRFAEAFGEVTAQVEQRLDAVRTGRQAG